jgi:sugar transferase (PEP-CTERM/EpsH1 system associated)
MRILFVVPNVPSFIRPRPLNFIRKLSEIHEVLVLCLATNDSDDRFVSELRQYCQNLEVIKLSRWRSLWNCIVALFSYKSLRVAYFYSPRLRDRVKARVDGKEVDLIHAEHLKSVPMVEGVIGKIPAIFDAVDCVSMLEMMRRKTIKNSLLKLFFWIESKKTMRLETKAAELFNRVVISSPVDKEAFPVPDRLRGNIDVITNGVDLEHFGFQQFEPQKNLLVFCAKLDYFPNQDAALYFTQSVWPVLRARRPELQLEIVGSRPPRSLRRLDGKDNIRVIASVPDVKPYLGRAWVALCPIRIRAGIQSKILEAMALGVPIVATRICLPGLAIEAGKHLLVADAPGEFVTAVELLLDNVTLRDKLVQAARTYVERQRNWTGCVAALCNAYAEAAADFRFRRGTNGSAEDKEAILEGLGAE